MKEFVLDIVNGEISLQNLSDPKMFHFIYDLNLSSGNWKERSSQEIEEISKNYIVFKINNIIIGGCYIKTGERNCNIKVFLECFRIKEKGCGFGTKALEKIKSIISPASLYTYSKKGEFFEKNGFKKVEGNFSKTGAQMYVYHDEN